MQPIVVNFSANQVRIAVVAVLIETFGRWRILAFAGLLVLLIYVAAAQHLIAPTEAFSAGSGVILGLLSCGALLLALYLVNVRLAMQAFQDLPTKDVEYELSEKGCTVSSSGWKGILLWTSIARLLRYPSIWLLEIKESRSKREIIQSFKGALKETGNVSATRDTEARRFPVFWAQPLPLQTFLVLPAKDINEEHVSFIRKMLDSAVQSR